MIDYTAGAFEDFDKNDIEGFIKNRFDEAKAAMEKNLNELEILISEIPLPRNDSDIIYYFCDFEEVTDKIKSFRRAELYKKTSHLRAVFQIVVKGLFLITITLKTL
jgi:type I restriction enzyme R subunit